MKRFNTSFWQFNKFFSLAEITKSINFHFLQTQMSATALKSWLLRGELEKLEHVVLEGRGARLLGEHSPDLRTRVFLKGLPNYLVRYLHSLAINFREKRIKNQIFLEIYDFYFFVLVYLSDENLSRS